MDHTKSVTNAFGTQAAAYLNSPVHAQGADLELLAQAISTVQNPSVLDLGCGAGHASFAVAPHAAEVVAYDLTPSMLATVNAAASQKGLKNIRTHQGRAESLPFQIAQFNWVISRYSAHHWRDVPRALAEVRRVLKPAGRVLFIDVEGGPEPLLDTHLQAVELLRDASHVRNYGGLEWLSLFHQAGLTAEIRTRWRLPIDFPSWISRIGTPPDRVHAIRSLWAGAPQEVKSYYGLQSDLSFLLDAVMIEAKIG